MLHSSLESETISSPCWLWVSLSSVPRSQCDGTVTFLSDPAFVGSAYIQESLPKGNLVGDDDKIYFFFSEAGKEFDFFDNTVVSRIARVCKVSDASGYFLFFFF